VLHGWQLTGAHALTIFLFFNVHAALAMLNHSAYDVDVTVRTLYGCSHATAIPTLLRPWNAMRNAP
jgi:hypothetical protein